MAKAKQKIDFFSSKVPALHHTNSCTIQIAGIHSQNGSISWFKQCFLFFVAFFFSRKICTCNLLNGKNGMLLFCRLIFRFSQHDWQPCDLLLSANPFVMLILKTVKAIFVCDSHIQKPNLTRSMISHFYLYQIGLINISRSCCIDNEIQLQQRYSCFQAYA